MKLYLLLTFVAAVTAADRDDSRFVITSINGNNGRGDSSRFPVTGNSGQGGSSSSSRLTNGDRNDDRFGSNRGSSNRVPDYVRVEVEIQRLDNKDGILANGKKCDMSKSCDPRITAYLDAETPLSPTSSVPASKWPVIDEKSNTNSPNINKAVNRDICGGSVSNVNLRAKVVDVDVLTANDLINNFDCVFSISPRTIATDPNNAVWGPSTECKASNQPGKIRLFARQRAYEIPSSSCRAPNKSG